MWTTTASQRLAQAWGRSKGEEGFSTAELLGNAALAIAALVVIWAAITALGEDVVDWLGNQLISGGS